MQASLGPKGAPVRCCARPAWRSKRPIASRASVREFIATECPVAGFDGRYRERPRDADVEAAVLSFDTEGILTPGCQALLRAPEHVLEQVIQDQGQVLLCVVQKKEEGAALVPLQPPKGGSYSSVGQCYGLQRLPGGQGGYMRVVVQQRVVVQGIRQDAAAGDRAQGAVLQDRWAYYVRAQVVEEVLQAAMAATGGACSQETLDLNGQPADVRTAVASMQDVAQQLQGDVAEIQDMLHTRFKRQQQQQLDAAASDQLQEVMDEVARLLEFIRGPQLPAKGSDVQPYEVLQRLSYAWFAAEHLTSYAGLSIGDLLKQRRKALELTDLGLRLEAALDFVGELNSRLAARAALMS